MNYPDNWAVTELQELGEWKTGSTPRRSTDEYWGGDILWVSPKDMKTDRIDDTQDRMTEKALEETNSKLIPPGSIVVVTRSGILEHSFPVAVTEKPVTINQDLKAFIPGGRLDERYAYYFLRANELDILKTCTKDGTTVASINSDSLYAYEIPIPPLAHQERIVAKIEELFSKLDSGVSELEDAEQRLGTYRQALLHKATTGELTAAWRNDAPESTSTLDTIQGLREQLVDEKGTAKLKDPDRAEERDDLPSGWESATVEQISYSTRYGTSEKCNYDFDGVPVLRIPNIQNGAINLDDLKFARSDADLSNIDPLEPGDFLMVRTNGSSDLIGRAALVREEFDETMYFASYLIRFRITPVDPLPRWVNFVWNSWPIREKILEESATSAGQYNLSQSKVLQFVLPLPPLEEQELILERVGRKMSVIDQLEQDLETELTRSKRLRQSILKHAFEGNLVPQDPTEGPPAPNGGDTNLEQGAQATLLEVTSDVE